MRKLKLSMVETFAQGLTASKLIQQTGIITTLSPSETYCRP